ncbi:6-bladed beta-propeller [Psychroflexus montanilacus]|uniref:6-bladed beta-propeller n=1 Tax=Psychroflexus montanilacus TaxID=2873598 RepID=UPI001CCA4F0D|nr:6-bladed beta-propeller [Psychroflexus montanilacus]MBZ9650850.1 6-bladed beta-propeller [Psychroflexus montanilacus]
MKTSIQPIFYTAFIFMLLILSLTSCKNTLEDKKAEKEQSAQDTLKNKDIAVIKEAFQTDRDAGDNVDSPAVWHGGNGEHWLLATAKEGNAIIVYSAEDGSFIKRFGESGEGEGAFSRPNGITVFENLLLIVERDNHRVQVFNLPNFEPLGFFGQESLKKPYGISVMKKSDNNFIAYVTDNYETKDEQIPPVDELNERVHMFSFEVKENQLTSKHKKAFGDTEGNGVLHKVESILIDEDLERLLIADEYSEQRNIKIYSPEGEFTGEIISSDYFDSEPEGIALFECKKDTTGYYITTDQDYENNKFEVFDRKTLKHLGSFSGEITSNTDGVALTQKSFGDFDNGAFFPVHDDGSVTAISWTEIAESLGLKASCE